MARIRTIKPELPQSESLGRVSRDARLLFVNLFTIADDCGRLRGQSRLLASLLYPFDDGLEGRVKTTGVDVDKWLDELEREDGIRRYVADGVPYIQITKWLEHQKIDRPSPSRIPECTTTPREAARVPDALTLDLGPRTNPHKAPKGASRPKDFDAWYQGEGIEGYDGYPHKIAVDQAIRAWKKREKANALPDLQTLIDGTKRYISNVAEQRKRQPDLAYANPGTWLAGARWLDEPATPPAALVSIEPTGDDTVRWTARCLGFAKNGHWLKDQWGPKPTEPGCRAPEKIVAETNADGLTPPQISRANVSAVGNA